MALDRIDRCWGRIQRRSWLGVLLLVLLVLLCAPSLMPVLGATDLSAGLHPISGGAVAVATMLMKQSASAYLVSNPHLTIDTVVYSNNALVQAAYLKGSLDFAVSTAAFTAKQQITHPHYKAYPMVGNAIVPIYNLPASAGSDQLILSLPNMCFILRGEITRWNDTRLQVDNPKLTLPDLGITVYHLGIESAQNEAITSLCGKVDPVFATMIPRSMGPRWPTDKYFAMATGSNSDVTCSLVIDQPGSFGMAALQNVRAVEVATAAIKNLAGVVLQPTMNAISLNILELASQPLPPGITAYDLTLPLTPAAWPVCTMLWLWLDTLNPVSTCATKGATLNFLLWMYTSTSVKSIASNLNMVVMPDLFLEQTGILRQLRRDVQCQDRPLISTSTEQGFVQGYSAVASTVQLYTTVYYSQHNAYQFGFSRAVDNLALQRLVAHEVDLAVLDHARLTNAQLSMLRASGATLLPFAMSGVAINFALPSAISSNGAKWSTDSTLPRLFPLALDLETVAQIFVGNVTHWLDEQILATSPQLQAWFDAYPTANRFFKVITCCDAGSGDPAVAGSMLLRTLNNTHTARLPQYKAFFARQTPDWTNQLTTRSATFQSIDTESRVTSKATSLQNPPTSMSAISYRLIGGAESDPNTEFRLLHRGQSISAALPPSPDRFSACLADELATPTRIAQTIGNPAYRSYVSGTEEGCYPLSTVVSVALNLVYTEDNCPRGNYSLNLYKFAAAGQALSLAALNAGVLRLSDLPAVAEHVERTLNTATCDGEALLLTLPKLWTLNSAIYGFGLTMVGLGLTLLLASMVALFVYRKRVILRSSSVPFLALILLGLAMLISSLAPLVTQVTQHSCHAFVWLASVGFTFVFVPFFAKTWRIYMIFNRRHLRVVKLSNRKLLCGVGLLIVSELGLLLAWSLVSPLQPVTYVRNIGGNFHQATHCSVADDTGMAFVGVQAAIKGAVLLFGALMAFGTRKVSSAFNEAEAIAWAVYNSTFSAVLVGAIIYFVDAFEDTLILLLLFLLFWIVLVTWSLVFATKFYALWSTSEAVLEQISKVDSLHTERSTGGFSFVSVVHMPAGMIKGYINALEIQINKARKQLSVVLGTTGATLGIGANKKGTAGAATSPQNGANLSGLGNGGNGGNGSRASPLPNQACDSGDEHLLLDVEPESGPAQTTFLGDKSANRSSGTLTVASAHNGSRSRLTPQRETVGSASQQRAQATCLSPTATEGSIINTPASPPMINRPRPAAAQLRVSVSASTGEAGYGGGSPQPVLTKVASSPDQSVVLQTFLPSSSPPALTAASSVHSDHSPPPSPPHNASPVVPLTPTSHAVSTAVKPSSRALQAQAQHDP